MLARATKWFDEVGASIMETMAPRAGEEEEGKEGESEASSESEASRKNRSAAEARKDAKRRELLELARRREGERRARVEREMARRRRRARREEIRQARAENRFAKGESAVYTPKVQVEYDDEGNEVVGTGGGGLEVQEKHFDCTIVGVHLEDGVSSLELGLV